jgi:hypothetical protein
MANQHAAPQGTKVFWFFFSKKNFLLFLSLSVTNAGLPQPYAAARLG